MFDHKLQQFIMSYHVQNILHYQLRQSMISDSFQRTHTILLLLLLLLISGQKII